MTLPDTSDPLRFGARPARAPRVLVVDDESDLRELLELTLVGMGLDVDCAADLGSARRLIGSTRFDLCLTDMRLPDGDGLSLVTEIGATQPDTPVAVITAYGSAENAVAALKAGAFDYLSKPVGLEALRALVRSALRVAEPAAPAPPADVADVPASGATGGMSGGPRQRTATGQSPASSATDRHTLIGESPVIESVRQTVGRLARSMAPVAITGESGSGKELAARLIHQSGSRAAQPFVAVNCGAIPENLMESEFFGYRRGAFTGADQDRVGFFQAASGGTLFLDEVADLPLPMQVKLLRAIQERRVRRVGGIAEEPVDVRIVSATHQDLARCVTEGRFRQDLYYRLNVIELRMPGLRERPQDVPLIADALLARLAARAGWAAPPRLSALALSFLQAYPFPGNVRELENILERALAFSNGELIEAEDLGLRSPGADPTAVTPNPAESSAQAPRAPAAIPAAAVFTPADSVTEAAVVAAVAAVAPDGVPASLPDYLEQLEREAIQRALVKTHQNRTAAARLLGISFRALRHRMQRLDMN